ncbi:MAG TPA: S9 family peptidase [Candidatus Polarisedimenticolia bacterium]|nr:S9 family peptidase [Candidatus Polarisedimenticolia bacterium]
MKLVPGLALVFLGVATASAADPPGTYDIERYLNIRSAISPQLSPDAKSVAFLTNVTGSNQIWTVPAQGGWPDQITFFGDRVTSIAWSPRGDRIAYSKDTGGDENFQIQVVSPDGSRQVALTSNPAVRYNFGSWSKDGAWISYSSNERDPKWFDAYVMNVETRQARRVLEKDALFSARDFSNDGTRLLVSRDNASLDNDLFVLDLSTAGAAAGPVHLTPHEGRVQYRVLGWTADDSGLWVLSDENREFLALGRLDIGARKIKWIREPKWDVTSGALSRDGRTLAIAVNADGYDELSILDAATLKERPALSILRGQIDGLTFSGNGKLLAMSLSGPSRTADVWIADLASGRLARVTRSSTAGIAAAAFVEPQLVRYRTFDGKEIPSFLYLPKGAGKGDGLPCIVTPHGGPEGQTVAGFSPVTQYYVNRGYAVWAPNVRGSTGYGKTFTHLDDVRKREDSVKDLVAGVDWLKASGYVDARKIAVAGGSYGGYMTLAAVTLYPDLWAAAVDSYGIANFRTFFGKTASYRAGLRATEYGDPVADGEFLDSISPIHKVDRIKAPLLVLQGANDPRVPAVEAEQIVKAVRDKGGVAEYILFPDEGHGWSKLANRIAASRATVEFLDRHLRGVRQAP